MKKWPCAVMSGANRVSPVIIAAIDAAWIRHGFLPHLHRPLASRALIVVNGPIAEIGMNGGMGYLGPGCRASNAIGRAVNLCMINLG